MRRGAWVVSCVMLALAACSRGPVDDAPLGPTVLTDSQIQGLSADGDVTAGRTGQALGEDCDGAGSAACRTGICLKSELGRGRGFFCSRECDTQRDCPQDWLCRQAMPGPHGTLCIPPSQWTARAVGVRP